jgi:cytochrome c oxidase subunit II
MTDCTSRRRRWLTAGALLCLGIFAAACGDSNNNGQNALHPKGSSAHKILNLFTPIFWVAIVIGVAVIGGVIYMALRFRVRPGGDNNPKQVHGNTPLEIGWTIVPALILAVVAVPTIRTIFDLSENPGKNAVQVKVIGKQWWWQFETLSSTKKVQAVGADELVIPTGRKVNVDLSACDPSLPDQCNVIHSFWVPELAGKQDVVPGRHQRLTLEADKPGVYDGQCAEYCGLSHANMRFKVIAKSPSDYAQWLDEQKQGPATPLNGPDKKPAGPGPEAIAKFACTGCHTFSDPKASTYGPNLTHLASRSTFASGYYKLDKSNLVAWLLDAPSLIPMESKDCRLPPPATCVGMPSFTKNTPPGLPVMSNDEADKIAGYLLTLK